MGLPLRCPCHRRYGNATWRSQHCNDVSLFAFARCSRLRRLRCGARLPKSCRLCHGLELYGLARGRSLYARYGSWACCRLRVMRACASTLALVIRISFGCAATIAATTEAPPQRRCRRGRIPKRRPRSELDTVPLCLREKASPFWIILLLVEGDREHPRICQRWH